MILTSDLRNWIWLPFTTATLCAALARHGGPAGKWRPPPTSTCMPWTGGSTVQINAGGALLTDLHGDGLLTTGLAEFRRQVRDCGVFANVQGWEDTADGKPWSWMAVWNPERLRPFQRVVLLANAFRH